MALLRKLYISNDVVCDVRNTRNKFFKIMHDNHHVADIDTERNKEDNVNEYVLRVTLLYGLEEHIYHDIMEIISKITKDNHIFIITISELSEDKCLHKIGTEIAAAFFNMFHDCLDHTLQHTTSSTRAKREDEIRNNTPHLKSFPKYRRNRTNNFELEEKQNKTILSKEIKHVIFGKFTFIKNNNRTILINRHELSKLVELEQSIEYGYYNSINHVIPLIALEKETIILDDYHNELYIDDIKTLRTIKFIQKSFTKTIFYINPEQLKTDKIYIPYGSELLINFVSIKTLELVKMDKSMLDLNHIDRKTYDVLLSNDALNISEKSKNRHINKELWETI